MSLEYRKFDLSPGQKAPEGSTGRGTSDGWIIWVGEKGTFPSYIKSQLMTQKEIDRDTALQDTEGRIEEAMQMFKDAVPLELLNCVSMDTYIDTNVKDMDGVRAYLKIVTATIIALLRRVDMV